MKRLLIAVMLVMVFGVGNAMAQYQYEVAPADTKDFTTLVNVVPSGTVSFDIYLTGVPGPQNTGGVYLDFTDSTADIAYVSAGRAFQDGSEGVTVPGHHLAGALINEPAGPGTLLYTVANLAGAAPDGDGNLIVGRVTLQNTGSNDAVVRFSTIPGVGTWSPLDDFSITTGVVTVSTSGDICEGDLDIDLDVDGEDLTAFLEDFGRGKYSDPCPTTTTIPAGCPSGLTDCTGMCVDTETNESYCGSCTNSCVVGEMCVSGICDVPSLTCVGTLSPLGRWCDQGDGTVKDMTNGLVWLKKADWGGQYVLWADYRNPDAHTRAADLYDGSPSAGTAGLSDGSVEGDWRLPTKTEILNLANGTEAVRSDSMRFFTGVQSDGWYGSSSSAPGFPDLAWHTDMLYGWGQYDSKNSFNYVWPVRGGQ